MSKKIAVLRGINVGGKRKLLMADLKELMNKLGFKDILTYIQSGNIVFSSEFPPKIIETQIEKAIKEQFDYDVPVIVKEAKSIEKAVQNNPYFHESIDLKTLHITFLKDVPSKDNIKAILEIDVKPDQFTIVEDNVYLFVEGKFHQSKLTNNFFEKKLGVGATTRNWKTTLKLLELSKS